MTRARTIITTANTNTNRNRDNIHAVPRVMVMITITSTTVDNIQTAPAKATKKTIATIKILSPSRLQHVLSLS